MTNSARSRLLFGRSVQGERVGGDVDVAELGAELTLVQPRTRTFSEERRKLEHAISSPQRHEPNEAAKVILGVEPVQSRRRDDRGQARPCSWRDRRFRRTARLCARVFQCTLCFVVRQHEPPSSKKRWSTSRWLYAYSRALRVYPRRSRNRSRCSAIRQRSLRRAPSNAARTSA